jgi:Protein tyrosine and serine/threonine kinase
MQTYPTALIRLILGVHSLWLHEIQVIKHAKGSWQSDVYAFGILLWELATREEVHAGLSAAQVYYTVY